MVPGGGGRRRARSTGYLMRATVTTATRALYKTNVMRFLQWVADNNDGAADLDEFDELLVDYVHELHATGAPKSRAERAVNGIIHYAPEFRWALPRSKQAVRGWYHLEGSESYPPLSRELAVVVAVQMRRNGRPREAIGVLLAFDCMLRVGELCALRRDDVADDGDSRVSTEHKGMFVRLVRTKTGNNKHVEVLDPTARRLVRQLVATAGPGDRLFPFSTETFRRVMKATCSQLGLHAAPVDYVPHSLRHGGATYYYFVKRMPMEDVLYRGRWESTKSARTYLHGGFGQLLRHDSVDHRRWTTLGHSIIVGGRLFTLLSLTQKH